MCGTAANISSVYSEWLTHQHRDTLSSIVGHPSLTSYLAIADGEAIGRVKFEMTEVRVFRVLEFKGIWIRIARDAGL